MPRVYRRKDRKPSFWIDYTDAAGKRHREPGANTHKQAFVKLSRILIEVDEQRKAKDYRPPEKPDTLRALTEEYLTSTPIAQKTRTNRRTFLKPALRLFHEQSHPRAVTAQHLTRYVIKRNADGVSPNTVWIEVATLRGFWKWMAETHPSLKLTLRFPSNRTLGVKRVEAAIDVLSPPEVDTVLAAAEHCGASWALDLFTMALFTGGRSGEIRALTRGDIRLDLRRVTYYSTKTKKHRIAPLNRRQITALRDRIIGLRDDELLFTSDVDRTPLSSETVSRYWRRCLKAAGIPHRKFHTARHTAISSWMSARLDLLMIMRWAGHSSLQQTQAYSHVLPQAQDEAQAALDDWYESQGGMVPNDDDDVDVSSVGV